MTAEHELWAVALWVEKVHGINGPEHIAEQMKRRLEAKQAGLLSISGVIPSC